MTAVLERTLELPPEPVSVRQARRFVREALLVAQRAIWQEAAELAVSELVTNAVLHGHSTAWVTVSLDQHRLRVEVRDGSARLPALRHYDDEATTGRGMALVAAVTDAHGVQELSAGGKVVWFVLGDTSELRDSRDPAVGGVRAEGVAPASVAGDGVVLQGLPPLLWLAACQHEDALLRELALVGCVLEAQLAGADIARARLRDAVGRAVSQWAEPGEVAAQAASKDVPGELDVHVAATGEDRVAFDALHAVLEAAERAAAAQRLLVPPSLPEVADMRAWACAQVLAQLDGRPPERWGGLSATAVSDAAVVPRLDASLDALRAAGGSVVAADETNRILSISPSLAQALGWQEADLVGRRVVVLVPEQFRQAHVAGFIRHVSTGATTVTGVPLELPLLHRDGREIRCRFLLETRRTGRGRELYLAWIDPLGDAV
ncbi:MAG: ATP-binding protein [Mycobacteriales bacterium]|nr:ATP-binding protein [Mycobacteriales bacterium]